MKPNTPQTSQPLAQPATLVTRSIVQPSRLRWLVLALLCVPPLLLQLLFNVQFMDGARNLHWSLLVLERPGYLVGQNTDPLDRIAGFVPDPATLAPLHLQMPPEGWRFNPWWGPLPIALNALVWWVTGSKLALTLIAPLCFAAALLATYAFARDLFGPRVGLAAAVFTGLFPIFLEYSVSAYAEPLMALLLVLTLWAYLRERTWLVVLGGAALALCKMHMVATLAAGFALGLGYRLWQRRGRRAIVHALLALLAPPLTLLAWSLLVGVNPGAGVGGSLSWFIFWQLLPQMLTMLFYLPWYGAALTLAVVVWCAWRGVWQPQLSPEARLVFSGVLAGMLLTLLVYTATPSASNSPRPALPALPLLAILVAAGWSSLSTAWARRVAFYLVALFLVVSSFTIYTMSELGRYQRTFAPVYALMQPLPPGFTIIADYWPATFQTRRGVAWFAGDDQFLQTMLHDPQALGRYLDQNPIVAVVAPRPTLAADFSGPAAPRDAQIQWGAEVIAMLRARAVRTEQTPYHEVFVLR